MKIFFIFLGPYLRHMEVPRPWVESAEAADLCHSCSNPRSLTHCASQGIKPVPPQRQWPGSLSHCENSRHCNFQEKISSSYVPEYIITLLLFYLTETTNQAQSVRFKQSFSLFTWRGSRDLIIQGGNA